MSVHRRSLVVLIGLLLAGCRAGAPYLAASPAGERSLSIAVQPVVARELLSPPTLKRHRLSELDHYVATLYVDTGSSTFVSTGASTTCSTQPGAYLSFGHLAARRYQVQVVGYDSGNVAITQPAKSNVLDLTGNDLAPQQHVTVTVTLDQVFAGSVRLPAVDWAATVEAKVQDASSHTLIDQVYNGGLGATVNNLVAGGSYTFLLTASDGHGYTEAEQLHPQVSYDASATSLPTSQAVTLRWHSFKVGQQPHGLAIDPANHHVWVANTLGNSVTELDLTSELVGSVLGTFSVGHGPMGVAVDGSSNVWVTNETDNTVTKLSSTGTVLGTFNVGQGPRGIAFDASNDTLWVANHGAGTVTGLDLTGTTIATLTVSGSPDGIAVGGGFGWVVGGGTQGKATRFDTGSHTAGAQVSVGADPIGVTLLDGRVYVTNSGDGTVTSFGDADGTSLQTQATDAKPMGLVNAGFAGGLVIAGQGSNVIRQQSTFNQDVTTFPISAPYGVAWDAAYQAVWATSPGSNLVTEYALAGGS